ncbi:MAG: non-canonical purine NTP pyrophosphatase [bacterium]
MELIYVTQNKNKVEVAKNLLNEFDISNTDFAVPEIQSLDPHEIVKYKLQYAYDIVKKPCLVTDDSLYIEALNGFPGPFIKWYYDKTVGAEKTCQIANLFNQHGIKSLTILGYYDGQETHYFEESVEGIIPSEPRGDNGFSWDPIFIPEGDFRTYAEMTFEEKHSYTVTGKVFKRLRAFLDTK